MTQPIIVRADLVTRAAYVGYLPGPSVQTIDLNETGSVAYDIDEAGAVIGIEIVGFDSPDRVQLAREFARDRQLAFPRDVSGTLVGA
jgi:uncharacterized protein YuzE